MRVWEIQDAYGLDHLRLVEKTEPKPGPGQIILGMKAASLNYRDLLTVKGMGGGYPLPLIPFSDGAGEVLSVGSGVTRVKAGDRVAPSFFQSWRDGPIADESRAKALGGSVPGVLQERLLIDAEGVSRIPDFLSYEEAACLPCAGLTAWRAVAIEAPVRSGQTVLVQGTGGVSIFALQFAKMLGARVIATSSSEEKLQRAKALGADHVINYKTTPEWGRAALDLTGGKGVDLVVEVGGENTLQQSMTAARVGGSIVVIGVLGGFSSPVFIPMLFGKNLTLTGITVGSRAQFDDMASAMSRAKLKPVVDKIFPFAELPQALKLMEAGGHFGKIVVKL